MNVGQNKVMDLKEAIATFVKPGCHLSIGGFTINRNPMAAVYEIIRQKINDIHLYVHSNGQGMDELIGAGCVARLEIAYGGNGKFASTCIRFKKAVQAGNHCGGRLHQLPDDLEISGRIHGHSFFCPPGPSLGTDIINRWGIFQRDEKKGRPKIPDEKPHGVWKIPLPGGADTQKVVLVPAINPDVTIIHVQKADQKR